LRAADASEFLRTVFQLWHMVSQRLQNRLVQPVVEPAASALHQHEIRAAQDPKVVGEQIRRDLTQGSLNLADAKRTALEQLQDTQPCRIAQGAELRRRDG